MTAKHSERARLGLPARTRTSRLFLLGALSLLLAGALLTRRNTAASLKSVFTAQQILNRSAPICTDLAPDSKELRMSADYMERQPHGRWDVSCTDADGSEVASMEWEDETGTLLTGGTPPQQRSRSEPLLRTPQQALASARDWLARLGYSDSRGERLLDLSCGQWPTPQWVVMCRFVDHEVVLRIDEYNGVLTYAHVKPPGNSGR